MLLNHNRFQPEIDWHQNKHISVTSYTKCHKTNTRNFAEVSHPIQKTRELLTRLKGKIGDFQNFNGLFFKLWYLSSFMIFCPCQYRVLLGRIKTHHSLLIVSKNDRNGGVWQSGISKSLAEYVQDPVCFVNVQSSLHENVVFSVCAHLDNAAYIICIKDQRDQLLYFETESETGIFRVSISRPSPRLKFSESQFPDRVRD